MASEENKRVYARYIELLNAQDFAALPEVVDPGRYREICVGFTPGWVDRSEASMFDYARLEDGRIVERIQQSDTLSQLRQMYSGAAKKAGLAAGAGLMGAALLAFWPRRGGASPGGR